jgi:hypothetical protein
VSDVSGAPDVVIEPVNGDPYTQPLPQPGERIHSIMPEQEEVLGGSQPTGVIPMLGGGGRTPAEPQLSDVELRAQARSAAHEGDQISTTVPTAGDAAATAHTTFDRTIATPHMAEDSPATMEKNAQIIRDYAGHTIPQDLSAADTIAAFKAHLKDNIIALHDAMPDDVRRLAMQWYDGANGMTHDMTTDFNANHGRGDEFNIQPRQTAAVIASQSPQTDWYQNVSRANRILEIHRTQQDNPMTPEMVNWGQGYADRMTAAGKAGGPVAQDFLDRNANTGVTYGQMDPLDQAHFVRFYDEAHNPRTYDMLAPTGEKLGLQMNKDKVTPSRIGWGSMPMIANATSVLQDGSLPNISANMGEAHKVRSFYNNIIAPYSNRGDTTVDTHAIAGANLFPLTGNDAITSQGLGSSGSYNGKTGSSGLYPVYADAYREAAADLSRRAGRLILPRQVQSMTWEGARGLFPGEQKALTSYRAPIEQVWTDHENGLLSQADAQAGAIRAAGGVQRPDWAGPAPAAHAEAGYPVDARELSRRGLPGRGAGAAAGGAGAGAAASLPAPGLIEEPVYGDPYGG